MRYQLAVDGQAYSPGALKSIASELEFMAKSTDESRGWCGGPMGDNVGQWTLEVPVEVIPKDLVSSTAGCDLFPSLQLK